MFALARRVALRTSRLPSLPRASALSQFRSFANSTAAPDAKPKQRPEQQQQQQQPGRDSTSASLLEDDESWRSDYKLFCATVVERMLRIFPEAPPEVQEFHEMQQRVHKMKYTVLPMELPFDVGYEKQEEEMLEAMNEEDREIWERLRNVKPAPRTTEADHKNDLTSLERALDKNLYLVVKQLPNLMLLQQQQQQSKKPTLTPQQQKDLSVWTFPTAEHSGSENLRQTAQRALNRFAEGSLSFFILGNGPIAHTVVEFTAEEQDKYRAKGMKTFFFRALHMEGNVRPQHADNFMWLSKSELEKYFPTELFNLSAHML